MSTRWAMSQSSCSPPEGARRMRAARKAPPPRSSLLAGPSPTPAPPSKIVIAAAVQAYVAALNTALRTGDLAAVLATTTTKCTCRKDAQVIGKVYAEHGRYVGTHFVVIQIAPTELGVSRSQARLTYRIPASAIIGKNGRRKPLKAHPARTEVVTLQKDRGRWLVASIGAVTKA